MQSLEVISVNLWQILISLCNLIILFLILKKFLYGPVKKTVADRKAAIEAQYAGASSAEKAALQMKADWEQKMLSADETAEAIIDKATDNASRRGREIVEESREEALRLRKKAEEEIALERKKAEDGIRHEIVEVSTALSEKVLGREIKEKDHRALIDAFLADIDSDNGTKS